MINQALWVIVALLVGPFGLSPQQSFEVASVKPNLAAPGGGFWTFSPPGEMTIINTELSDILALAYGVEMSFRRVTFVGGSQTVLRSRFDIRAKGAGDSRAMLRTLLEERFGVRVHREVRHQPIYALTVKEGGKLGKWIKPSNINCQELLALGKFQEPRARPQQCSPTREMRYGAPIRRGAGTIRDLIVGLAQPSSERPVIDATGLSGNFEWELAFDTGLGTRAEAMEVIRTAFEDQLGLKLERTSGPYEVILIDDVRMPSPD